MTSVLVVDDLAADRALVGGLLEEDANLAVEFAIHGADALAKMEVALPDLVITDLVMPEMDGLELVRIVRDRYPLLPIILITAQGNEEIAVRTLQEGAASYVPKRSLGHLLLETVRKVFALSRQERTHTQLMGCLAESDSAFVLENDPTLIELLAGHLQGEAARMGVCDEAEQTRIGIALEEALANALYHGNLEVSSELREHDKRAYHALAAQRRGQAPYCDRRLHVEARLSRQEVVFVVRDDGAGFDPATLPDPADPASLERMGGRGVLLMRTFMDDVLFNETGNCVTLIKRRRSRSAPVESEDP